MDEDHKRQILEGWLQRFQNIASRPGEFDAAADMAERLGQLAGSWSGELPFGAEPSGLFRRLARSSERP
jgi:hypothetical protein